MNQAAVDELATLQTIREAMEQVSVGRVFGAPINQDGLTLVPVAKIGGGGGAGGGTEPAGDATGSGGGFGLAAKPLGVFVISNGKVRWRPAIDVNKIILGGQIVAVTALLVVRALVKARSTSGGRPGGKARGERRRGRPAARWARPAPGDRTTAYPTTGSRGAVLPPHSPVGRTSRRSVPFSGDHRPYQMCRSPVPAAGPGGGRLRHPSSGWRGLS